MAEHQWISVAYAADLVGTSDAPQLIQRAWKLGTVRLYGVRPGETEPVEIPSSEAGTIDCFESRVGEGGLFTTYHSVTMKWDDAKLLTQADFERLLQEASTSDSAPKQPRQSASNSANVLADEAGPKAKAVASVLLELFPEGRPALLNNELIRRVREAGGGKLGVFSLRTLNRAVRLVWPPRQTAPDRAKPRQPSR